jgi:GNAT superfamily N-acetyltransferase
MHIRPARPDDVPAILDMIRALAAYERAPDAVHATEADLHAALFTAGPSGGAGPAAHAHVVEVEGPDGGPVVVAFALWFLNFSTWLGKHGLYLEDLYVGEAYRGRGIGAALLETLAALCVERGFGRFEWWVLDWNTPAIEFYRARGAVAMDEWTVYRVTGDALQALGARRGAGDGDSP